MIFFKRYFKNKFVIASIIFFIYALFLDDIDIFTIINQRQKLNKLSKTERDLSQKLVDVKSSLNSIKNMNELEGYAREKKLFKKSNEEIFIISYE
jgi:hypothetical protein